MFNIKKILIIFGLSVLGFNFVSPSNQATSFNNAQVKQSSLPSFNGYYNDIDETLTGKQLRKDVNDLITRTHTKYTSYDQLKTIFDTSDRDPKTNDGILLFYTGTKEKSYSAAGANREHVWPKNGGSAFPASSGPGSDAHHLRPTAVDLNSTRGSLSFDEITDGTVVKENGKTDYGNLCYKNSSFFYPGVGYRGATARILFYMETRWGDQYSLKFVDSAGHNKTIGKISTLMKWHLLEPPTDSEILRNEEVFKIQGNRNPFIDHPEYAVQIYANDGEAYQTSVREVVDKYGDFEVPPIESLTIEPSNFKVALNESVNLTINTSPSNAKKAVTWEVEDTNIVKIEGNTLTGLKVGETTITAKSVENPAVFATTNVTVRDVVDIEIVGSLTKTEYQEGEKVSIDGLKVNAIFNDNSKEDVTHLVKLLDGNTRAETLSLGTTSVIVKYGNIEKIINNIVVKPNLTTSTKIDISSFDATSSYGWQPFNSNGLEGKAYIYGGNVSELQFNSNKDYYHAFNTTSLGNIKSITITADRDTKYWSVKTSETPFSETDTKGTNAFDAGTQIVTTDGVKFECNSTHPYFCIEYRDNGATYLRSIEVEFETSVTPEPEVDNIELTETNASIKVGETYQIKATSNTNITYKSNDETIASVSETGFVTGLKAGNTAITLTAGKATKVFNIEVKEEPQIEDIPVSKIELNKSKLELKKGDTFKLEANILPINATNKTLTWESSNSEIATIENGLVTAKNSGTCKITVKSNNNVTAECEVIVLSEEKPEIIINIKLDKITAKVGESVEAEIETSEGIDASLLEFKVEDTTIANFENGKITGLKPGNTTLTVKYGDISDTCNIEIIEEEKAPTNNSTNIIIIASVAAVVGVIAVGVVIFVIYRKLK